MSSSRARSLSRPGGVDVKLILALSVLALVGVIWLVRWSSDPSRAPVPERVFTVVCSECKYEAQIPGSELDQMESDPEAGAHKCPQCGKFTFRERRPNSSIIEMDP